MHALPAADENRPVVEARRPRLSRNRRGSEVLELIVVLPVLILIGAGIVSFGIFYSNRQQVALASRVAAVEASQTTGLPTSGSPPANVLAAIEKQLAGSGIEVYSVRLEHNTGSAPVVLEATSSAIGSCGPQDTLPQSELLDQYVRVTVCVPMSELMPNLLAPFGASIAGEVAQATALFRYEMN